MQVTETNAQGLKHEFTVTVGADEIAKQVERRLAEIGRSLRLPGFRPGKAPLAVLKKRYGPSVMGEVVERAVNDSSSAAIAERKLRPALQPKIEIVSFNEGKDLEYKLAVEVLPEIPTMSFADLTLERWKPEVPDAEIDGALERIAQQQRKSEKVDRAAAKGDVAVIDFVGSIDGTPFPGGAGNDVSLEIGSGHFIPGFEDQLIGAAAGDAREIGLTFPADYGNAELAGKPAKFAVTVKEIKAFAPQPVDESLAAAIGMENLASLRQTVRERMEREYEGLSRAKLKRELLDMLSVRQTFPVPEGMLQIEFDALWRELEAERARAKQAGETDPDAGKSEDDLKTEYRALAERRVRLGLLLNDVGRLNSISVTAEEVNRAAIDRARGFPGQEKEVLDYFRNNPGALDGLKAPILENKVVDFILELAKVSERTVKPEELVAAANAVDDDSAAEPKAAKGKSETKTEPKAAKKKTKRGGTDKAAEKE
jgi:trigger factor